jgi:urocanate hydratase
MIPELVNKGIIPNLITDATNTDLNSYFPAGYSFSDALRIRRADSHHSRNISRHSIMMHVKALVELQKRGSLVFEFGNGLRQKALDRGFENALAFPDITESLIFPVLNDHNLFNVKWAALSGIAEDLFIIDDVILSEFRDQKELNRMVDLINKVILSGLPARKTKLDFDNTLRLCRTINELVHDEEIGSPIMVSISTFKRFYPDPKSNFNEQEVYQSIVSDISNPSWLFSGRENDLQLKENVIIADGSKDFEARLDFLLENVNAR